MFLKKNFYVDDLLHSAENEDEELEVIMKVIKICAAGGFRLTKFASKSRKILQNIQPEELAKDFKELNLSSEKLPVERALGVCWMIENDSLGFRINLQDKPLTRRGILSTISSIYDPLGLVGPFLLAGKILLQKLVKEKYDWDDEIRLEDRITWEKWRTEIHELEVVSVPRCFKKVDFHPVNITIHHFSDASIVGYGQASYIRLVDKHGNVCCSLVIGKSRVAPVKQTTIPRLVIFLNEVYS